MAGTIVGAAALVAAVVSALIALRSDRSARRSADEAVAAGRRQREPRLAIVLSYPEPAPNDLVIYRVRNDGPQDLDSVAMHWPLTPEGSTHPLAATGRNLGFTENPVPLGPLALTREAKVTLMCGGAPELPEFRMRIECRAGTDEWTLSLLLPDPRGERSE